MSTTGVEALLVSSGMTVVGTSTFSGAVTMSSTLAVTGAVTTSSGVTVGSTLTIASGNVVVSTGAGTKFATSANQLIAFWNAAPIVQPTSTGAASTFAANTSAIADDTATFDGYTIGTVVKALRNAGILA